MTCNSITVDKNTYESLQQELVELRQMVWTLQSQKEVTVCKSEAWFARLADNVPGVIYQFQLFPDGTISFPYVSSGCRELYELEPSQVYENPQLLFEVVHPRDLPGLQETIAISTQTLENWEYEWLTITPSGKQKWLKGISKPEPQSDGSILWDGCIIDVSELQAALRDRKQAEIALQLLNEELEVKFQERTAALHEKTSELEAMLNAFPDLFFRLAADSTILDYKASSQNSELYVPPEVFLEKRMVEVLPPEVAQKMQQAIVQVQETSSLVSVEYSLLMPNGEEYYEARLVPFVNNNIILIVRNVSEEQIALRDRSKAEQQLQQQAQFLQSIWEGVDYGIFVMEVLDDGAEFRYINFNPAMAKTSPVPMSHLLGKTIAEALPTEMANLYRQRYSECVKSGKSTLFEEHFSIEGETTWWLLNVTPLKDSNSQIYKLIITATNITERKRTEQERQMFVSLIENSNDFIGIGTLEGHPLFINEAGRKLVGIDSLEAVKSIKIEELFLPEDREYLQQCIIPAVIEDGLWQSEYRFRHFQTEEPIPVDCNTFLIKNPETGEPLCMATITRDIRDRQKAEAQLQEKEQFLRSIYDGVECSIFVIDVLENGEFRSGGYNLNAEKATGMRSAEVVGKNLAEIFGATKAAEIHHKCNTCLVAGVAISFEECLTLRGQENWLLTTLNPLKDSEGRIYRLVGTTFYITERKKAEVALKASQHFIQRITDSIPNTIYIYDLEEQRNIYANHEIAEILGYSIEEVQEMGAEFLSNTLHPDDWEKVITYHQKFPTAVDGKIFEIEYRMKDVHGKWHWVYSRDTSFSRNADGKVKQLLGVATDITVRKEAEIQLQQQTEYLENTLNKLQRTQAKLIQSEKMSSLGNMVAGVAHEINNPVNFIHANLTPACEYSQDLLRLVELYQQYYPNPPEEIEEKIEDIDLDFIKQDLMKLLQSMRVGTERIREIVLSLRNFSRLDEAEFKRVNIHEGIESTLMILHNRLKAKPEHPEISVIKEYGKLPSVECYPGQLNQVFMNIFANSIDALEESFVKNKEQKINPQICISTEVVNGNWIAIRIADNGQGIPPEILSKLFDPFFTTKDVGKGTGLGLSISYQIVVDKHGGKLSCHSILGQGAEFVIEIPVTQVKTC
ncbi:PAS domain S-box protein [Tolypothrix sp. VBCCA 56010]|uniref:PAS domain-containing sensor histidine kinase n=1 Tax=Tolypothrix sp. VBCCA 56010 TaxID=3137731 RepID=UPI003D7CA85A